MKNKPKRESHPITQRLVEAIRAIPETAAASPREQLLRFAEHSIDYLLWGCQRKQRYESFLLTLDRSALTFSPAGVGASEHEKAALIAYLDTKCDWKPNDHAWKPPTGREALFAYLNAVSDASPFEDFLTPVCSEMVGTEEWVGQQATPVLADRPNNDTAKTDWFRRMSSYYSDITLKDLRPKLKREASTRFPPTYWATDADPLRVALAILELLANQLLHGFGCQSIVMGVGEAAGAGRVAMTCFWVKPWMGFVLENTERTLVPNAANHY